MRNVASTSRSRLYGRQRAFTLIELLVVLSIFAILISIILPAMAAARGEGIKTKCLSNMRGIAQTATAYSTDDPRGVYGPVHPNAEHWNGEGYADYGGGPGNVHVLHTSDGSNQVEQPFLWEQDFGPESRPFNKLIYGVEGLGHLFDPDNPNEGMNTAMFNEFRCPGDDFGYQEWPNWQIVTGCTDEVIEHSFFVTNGTSYRLNNLMYNDGGDLSWIDGVYNRSVAQVPDASVTVGFMEARAFQTLYTNDVWGWLQAHGELTGYHKKLGRFNLSYVDGHAGFVNMGNGTFYPQRLDDWYYDVRGTWGRMDCLPDKMIKKPFLPSS